MLQSRATGDSHLGNLRKIILQRHFLPECTGYEFSGVCVGGIKMKRVVAIIVAAAILGACVSASIKPSPGEIAGIQNIAV